MAGQLWLWRVLTQYPEGVRHAFDRRVLKKASWPRKRCKANSLRSRTVFIYGLLEEPEVLLSAPLLVELPEPVELPELEPCKLLSLAEPLPRCWFRSLEPG